MQASIAYQRNPFAPRRDRELRTINRRLKVSRVAKALGVDPKATPILCFVNGAPLLQRHWRSKRLRDGDVLAFVKLPQGGGGGGSNALRIVAMIAVIAVAYWAGPIIATQLGFGTTGLAASLATAGVALAGSVLVNALIPPPKPAATESVRDLAAASPTYSLQAQGNQARLGQAIPVSYGRHLIFPDFAAMPYAEFAGNEQFLYQLFCVGQGSYLIEEMRIEDTPLSSFQDVQTEVIEPGGTVTLFPTNVVTSVEVSGQECLYAVTQGPFIVNPAGTTINAIALDMVASRGLFIVADDGSLLPMSMYWYVEAQAINDAGVPTGAFFPLGAAPESMSAASQTPQRFSYRYDVSPGRYQVKVTRSDVKNTSTRVGHELDWFSLRGYMPGSQNYGEVTLLAIRMRASNQLSGLSSRKVNVIATRKLPIRVNGQWTAAVATRSIAWALADACMNSTYGGGRLASQISIGDLDWLDAVWTARGDTFNGIFDSTQTFWEALTQIARAGRAVPILQGGTIYFVRDQQGQIPTALYSMRNIVRGSFNLRYLMHTEDTVDGMAVTYFDEQFWRDVPVVAMLPGQTGVQPGKTKLFGVTNQAQAWREGMTMLASNRYRRKFSTFQTELEGHLSFFGDLVRVQHDLPEWGQFGEVLSYDAGTKTVVLNEPMEWTGGAQHYVGFRTAVGGFSGPWACSQGATAATLVLTYPLDFAPYTGQQAERTQAVFGPGEAHSQLCRVLAVRPRGELVEIAVVNEDDRVHTADGGAAPPGPGWDLPPPPTVPVIIGDLLVVGGGSPAAPTVAVSWAPASGAYYYIVEWSTDGASWTRIGEVTLTNIKFGVVAGLNYIRVAPVGKAIGPWRTWSGQVTGEVVNYAPPPAITGLTATGLLTSVILQWNPPSYTGGKYYEILRNTVNNSATASVIDRIVWGPAMIYEDALGLTNATRWYWVRIISNTVPEYVGIVSNAATATTGFVLGSDIGVGQVFNANVAGGAITETKIADNAISSPKIIANAIIAGKLAADSVLTANLAAGQITSSKIAGGQIVASHIAGSQINAFHLAANSIAAGSAVIADAALDTLKLAGQSVTIPVSAIYNGSVQLAPGFWFTVQVAGISTSGAPISITSGMVMFYPNSTTLTIRLSRNGAGMREWNIFKTISSTDSFVFPAVDQLYTPQDVSYSLAFLQNNPDGNNVLVSDMTILLLETKR